MCTGGRAYGRAGVLYVINKFSLMDSLPYFLTHGTPLRARESSAKTLQSLFINVVASPKIHVPVTAAIIRINNNPCYTV